MAATDFTQLECKLVILTYKIAVILLAAGVAVAIVIIFILGFRLRKMARGSPSCSELRQPHTSINCAPMPDNLEAATRLQKKDSDAAKGHAASDPAGQDSSPSRGRQSLESSFISRSSVLSDSSLPRLGRPSLISLSRLQVDISGSESRAQSNEIPVAATLSCRESRHGSFPKSSFRQSSIESSSSGSSLSSSAQLELMQKSRWARRHEAFNLDLWPDFDSVGKYVTDREAEGRDVTRRSLTPSFTMSTTPSEGHVDDARKSESKSLTTPVEAYQAQSSDTARKTATI